MLITRQICLTAVSPIHVGGAVSALTPLEYVFGTVEGERRCYVVSEEKLGRRLLELGHLESLGQAIEQAGAAFDLRKFIIDRQLLTLGFLGHVSRYFAVAPPGVPRLVGQVRPLLRDPFDRPYLPGTSLKGVFRTAILYRALKRLAEEDPAQYEEQLLAPIAERLDEAHRQPGRRERLKTEFAANIERSVLQEHQLPRGEDRGLESQMFRFGPNTDILRCLKVSDSNPLDANGATIARVDIFSLRGRDYAKEEGDWVEQIPPGATTQFTLTWDQDLYRRFRRTNLHPLPCVSLDDAWAAVREFCQDQFIWEREFFRGAPGVSAPQAQQFYQQEQAPDFRLGWGCGLIGTTVRMLLPDELAFELRDTLFLPRHQAEFPKQRRHPITVTDGQETLGIPFGWANVQILDGGSQS